MQVSMGSQSYFSAKSQQPERQPSPVAANVVHAGPQHQQWLPSQSSQQPLPPSQQTHTEAQNRYEIPHSSRSYQNPSVAPQGPPFESPASNQQPLPHESYARQPPAYYAGAQRQGVPYDNPGAAHRVSHLDASVNSISETYPEKNGMEFHELKY